jgi:hypothetical protein
MQMIGLNSSNTRGLAYVNHGRWLADCPACGSPILLNPEKEDTIQCGVCNPQLLAIKLVPIPGDPDSGVVPKAYEEMRAEARKTAMAHKVIIPENWREIFETLRPRPTYLMNWLPGETLDTLRAQNIEHGIGKV